MYRKYFALAASMILVAAAVWMFKPSSDSNSEALAAEFGQAYPEQPDTSGSLVEFDLVAEPTTIESISSTGTEVWAYNGSVPGPEFRVTLGDTIRINFENKLPQETSIHWHGLRVPNGMDGVPGVTQDAIPVGGDFVYEFTPPDAGTFWFHPHSRGDEQLERGLYGTLIVEDPKAEEEYSQDVVWVLDDWLLDENQQVNQDFDNSHDITHNGRWGNTFTVNGSTAETLTARPGERVRLRLVNTSNARIYEPEFTGMDANIIAVDGLGVSEPIAADRFALAPGNRIDVDVKIPDTDQPLQVLDNFSGDQILLTEIIVEGEPADSTDFEYAMNSFVPEWDKAVDLPADQTYILSATIAEGKPAWAINGKVFPDRETYEMKQGEFKKIRFMNDSQLLHPMHLHGQFFKVITRNGQAVEENYFRDTVLLTPGETIEIGLVPLDKGEWALHCHIQEHAEAGMITTFDVI